ncbi:uncharacterized protein YegL [Arthrobacter pascens]|uniref:vWA domain-containing protein n=1 Tax=Arthrobacter pascens TaxID=1677 RepID=UPI002786E990|nr:VWA domain-containing protein [Arthrobacter pascens]MDQ0633700.1 uncharacterized protein YegL [Arthrobacter pascens]
MTQETTAFRAAQDSAVAAIVPILLLLDVSGSMESGPGDVPPIDAVNMGVESLITTLKVHPEAADCALVGIAKFSGTAEMVLPFTHISTAAAPPRLHTESSTEFGNAFRLCRFELEAMVTAQKATGATVYRPTVYMITDGEPTDTGWEAELDALSTSTYAPNICVFGVAGATEATLRKIARRDRGHVWLADQGTDPAAVFGALFPALVRSVMLSASAAATAGTGAPAAVPSPIPATIPGMTTLDPM